MQVRRKWQTSLALVMALIVAPIAPVSLVGAAQASPVPQPDEGWVMDSDGSNQHKLLDMLTALSRPSWSPDGTQVAFSDSSAGLVVVAADGSTQRTLVASGATGIDWSPDGTSIALSYNAGSGRDIYLIDPDGSNLRRLSNTPGRGVRPNWSPDGSMVAFLDVDFEDGTPGHALYVINADGTAQRQIADGIVDPVNMNALTWSPDGTRIAAATHDGDIVVVAVDGSGITNVTTSEAVELSPDWSPDGSRIAFERAGEIYSATPDGSAVTELHDNPKETDSDPQWSPDSTRIAFVMSGDIHTIALDGSSDTNLTSSELRTERLPAWSPDSAAIAFIAEASSGVPQCDDGADNDGDGAVDYPADAGCSSASDNREENAESVLGGQAGDVVTSGPCAGQFTGARSARPGGGEIIVGTDRDDFLPGTRGNDLICALGGDDVAQGAAGADQVYGGGGKDIITGGRGADELLGGIHNDNISGGSGQDALFGASGWDTLKGNADPDRIVGAGGNDIIQGGGGDDEAQGNRGNDLIRGYIGNDVLRGGFGDDTIRGHRGRDQLFGGPDNDILEGGAGIDRCHPGRGSDITQRC